jgi:antitoxin component of RelBE/YafQ-DinJ toxin-antitoxin module
MDEKTEVLICRVDKKTHKEFKSLCVKNEISMQRIIETFIKGLILEKSNERPTR